MEKVNVAMGRAQRGDEKNGGNLSRYHVYF